MGYLLLRILETGDRILRLHVLNLVVRWRRELFRLRQLLHSLHAAKVLFLEIQRAQFFIRLLA